MKIFGFSLRDYDEKPFFIEGCRKYGVEYDFTSEYPSENNLELARGYEGVSIITNPMPAERLDRLYDMGVRFISTRSIGVDHIDVEHAKKIGMKICHVSYDPNSVANYTIMMMLMACRRMPQIQVRAEAQDYTLKGKAGKEFSDCTVGIIGTGRIGARVVQHLSGFGCRVLAYDLYRNEKTAEYAEYVDLDRIYAESDIITLHVPGTAESFHMVDAGAIAKMKDGVILVNAARGMLVDSEAMIAALKSGKIGFAALDTIENEAGLYYLNREGDVIDNDEMAILRSMPNVLLTPHMAFYTENAVRDMVENSLKGLVLCREGGGNPFEV